MFRSLAIFALSATQAMGADVDVSVDIDIALGGGLGDLVDLVDAVAEESIADCAKTNQFFKDGDCHFMTKCDDDDFELFAAYGAGLDSCRDLTKYIRHMKKVEISTEAKENRAKAKADRAAKKKERAEEKAAVKAAAKKDRADKKAATAEDKAKAKDERETKKKETDAVKTVKKEDRSDTKEVAAEEKEKKKEVRKEDKVKKVFSATRDCSAAYSVANATHIINPKHPKPSLAFVMDFSGSMGGVLENIKIQLELNIEHGIIDSASEAGAFQNGVVVAYSDPHFGAVGAPATSVAEFKRLIEKITISSVDGDPGYFSIVDENGGDCPEVVYGALLAAMEQARPYSRIMVYTDASGKDTDKLPAVMAKIAETNCQIIFVLNRDGCGVDENYALVAHESRGHVFRATTDEIKAIVDGTKEAQKFENYIAGISAVGVYEIQIPTPNSITDITITVSGGTPEIECRDYSDSTHSGFTDILGISRVLMRSFPRGYMEGVDRVSGFNHHLYCTIRAAGSYTIEISSGYKGCDHEVNPCMNGGVCKHVSRCDLFQCKCPGKFFGVYCEKHMDDLTDAELATIDFTKTQTGDEIEDDDDDWGGEYYDDSFCDEEYCEGPRSLSRTVKYTGNISGDMDNAGDSMDVVFSQTGDAIPDIDDGYGKEPAGFQL